MKRSDRLTPELCHTLRLFLENLCGDDQQLMSELLLTTFIVHAGSCTGTGPILSAAERAIAAARRKYEQGRGN